MMIMFKSVFIHAIVVIGTILIRSTSCQTPPDPVKTDENTGIITTALNNGRNVLKALLEPPRALLTGQRIISTTKAPTESDEIETKDFKIGHKFQPKLFKRLHNTFISINKIKIPFRAGTTINDAFHNPIGLVQVPAPLIASPVAVAAARLPIKGTFSDTLTTAVNNDINAGGSSATGNQNDCHDAVANPTDDSLSCSNNNLAAVIVPAAIGLHASATLTTNTDNNPSNGLNTDITCNQMHDTILPIGGGFNQPFNLIGYGQQPPAGVFQKTGGFQLNIGRLVHLKRHHSKVVAINMGRK